MELICQNVEERDTKDPKMFRVVVYEGSKTLIKHYATISDNVSCTAHTFNLILNDKVKLFPKGSSFR